jgi:DNA-binding IclR family transcriptional regulator
VGQALAGRVGGDGVVVVHDAVEPGVTAVAAPVRGGAGAIEAALSLVGPSFRLEGAALAEARQVVAAAALRLQSQLVGSAA